jgi:alginate O-acetyltransferase complex protein AlgJ
MARLWLRLLLFASPFLGLWAMELALPIDTFTFRSWEALSAHGFPSRWEGPFYPAQSLWRNETGDLGHHTPWAVHKTVRWETDTYGFRTAKAVERFDIVLLGDSNTAGSGLTQDATLAPVLERILGRSVYPYAPSRISSLLNDRRFLKGPPNAVVVVAAERALPLLNFETAPPHPSWHAHHKRLLAHGPATRAFLVFCARLRQRLMLQALRANISRYLDAAAEVLFGIPTPNRFFVGADDKTLFINENDPGDESRIADIPKRIALLKELKTQLAARGSWMLLAPVPNKATLYPELLPSQPRSRYLKEFTLAAKGAGLDVIDIQSLFETHRQRSSETLYLADDTHWNSTGVAITAEGIARALRRL